MENVLEQETDFVVRRLRPTDLERVVALDALVVGRSRRAYLSHKVEVNLLESSVQISLGVEVDGSLVGFLLARVWTGEFGATDPVAVLDTIGIHPDFQGRALGPAMMDQLAMNLRGLGVGQLRTELSWEDQDLLRFFHGQGFAPAPRLCLELDLAAHERRRTH
jgi:ribosomal protein S18 acetylase RimI-like enzyme